MLFCVLASTLVGKGLSALKLALQMPRELSVLCAFQLTIMPLHAYAALLHEETETAIPPFDKFAEKLPEDRNRASFVFFDLARAY